MYYFFLSSHFFSRHCCCCCCSFLPAVGLIHLFIILYIYTADTSTRSTNNTSLFVHYVLNFFMSTQTAQVCVCVCVFMNTQTHIRRSRVLGSIVQARRFPFTPVSSTSYRRRRRRRRHFDTGGRDALQTYRAYCDCIRKGNISMHNIDRRHSLVKRRVFFVR